MKNLNEIHWHDSEIESVIEIPAKDQLIYNVRYPENWGENVFAPRAITFDGFYSHVIEEIPFEGNPTILMALVVAKEGVYTIVKLKTNAGERLVTATECGIGMQRISI